LAPLNLVVLDERELYANAYFLDEINPGPTDWLLAPVRKLTYNARMLGRVFTSVARESLNPNAGPITPVYAFEVVSLGLIVISIPLGLLGLGKRALEPFLLACVAVPVTLLIAILSLYFVLYLQGVRILLLAVPFECIVWAAVLQGIWRTLDARGWLRRTRQILTGAGLGAGLVGAIGLTYVALAPDPTGRLHADREAAFLESVAHDPAYVLVAPWQIAFDYLYKHPNVVWSFVPANRATLHLLNQTHPVSTLILPSMYPETKLTIDDIRAEGFELEQTTPLDEDLFLVFRRRIR
jgi:hypothetical protein